jgi:hypothetical protein
MSQEMTIRDEYFKWLYRQIDKERGSFRKLCWILYNKPFRWHVPNDDNRAQDGLELRQLFMEENNLDETHIEVKYFLKGECTIFEMLVGLARRIDYQTIDLQTPAIQTAKWFWKLIENLQLDSFRDSTLFDLGSEETIEYIIEKMLDRTYDFNGIGSLFPMKRKPPKDMRKVEIWYQLMLWLDENYGLG